MPMVENVLRSAALSISDIDAFAVANGPGSFTGVRIGISAVKGMAHARKLPCIAVSTLEAMTYNYADVDAIICSVMDARCNQVYNALFKCKSGKVLRLCDDRALSIEELSHEIEILSQNNIIYIVGDGAEIFYSAVGHLKNVTLADEKRRFQNAVGVSLAAQNGKTVSVSELQPFYLRLPQAERELKRKEEQI